VRSGAHHVMWCPNALARSTILRWWRRWFLYFRVDCATSVITVHARLSSSSERVAAGVVIIVIIFIIFIIIINVVIVIVVANGVAIAVVATVVVVAVMASAALLVRVELFTVHRAQHEVPATKTTTRGRGGDRV
jgi:hypothetical protein